VHGQLQAENEASVTETTGRWSSVDRFKGGGSVSPAGGLTVPAKLLSRLSLYPLILLSAKELVLVLALALVLALVLAMVLKLALMLV
jgi:hypothetical protein